MHNGEKENATHPMAVRTAYEERMAGTSKINYEAHHKYVQPKTALQGPWME